MLGLLLATLSISVAWTPVTHPDLTHYEVEIRAEHERPAGAAPVRRAVVLGTGYTFTGLSCVPYVVRVRSCSLAGCGDWSEPLVGAWPLDGEAYCTPASSISPPRLRRHRAFEKSADMP